MPGIGSPSVNVPVEMQIKAPRWCSNNRRAARCTLACHRCLWISASSRNGLYWSKKRSRPILSFISQHAASSVTTHRFHFHSFSLHYKGPTTKTEDCFSLLCSPCCQNCFLLPSSSLRFIHQLHLFYHQPCSTFFLQLPLSHSWTNTHWHKQENVMLISRSGFSCIWPASSNKTSIND